jgi:uncharacterized protein YlxW (UPF0749 family)
LALLESLIADALDPGYAEAAARRSVAPAKAASRRTARAGTAISILVVSFVLTLAAEQVRASAPSVASRRQALLDRINQAGRDVNGLEQQVATTTAEVDRLRRQALGPTALPSASATELNGLATATGLAAATGPGVVLTLDDAPAAGSRDDDLGRVLDVDLQQAANGLWQAGAEAVSINGHRLTALSAIRGAGDAVLVDYRPLARPYVLTAIGGPGLASRFRSGSAGQDLGDLVSGYGIRLHLEEQKQVTVPAAPAVTLRSVRGAG